MRVSFDGRTRRFDYQEPDYYETVIEDRKGWISESSCLILSTPTNLFYSSDPDEQVAAKTRCFSCTAQNQCAEFAIVTREIDGIWGGLDERQRRIVKRRWRSGRRFDLQKLIKEYLSFTSPTGIKRGRPKKTK